MKYHTLLCDLNSIIDELSENIDAGACPKYLKADFRNLHLRAQNTPLGQINSVILERLNDLKSWLDKKEMPLSLADQKSLYADLFDLLLLMYRFSKSKEFPISLKTWKYILIQKELKRTGGKLLNAPLEMYPVSEKNGIVQYKLLYSIPVS
jgi:hypothetical protein